MSLKNFRSVPRCVDTPMEMWQPGDQVLEQWAKAVCARCPLVIDCRIHALEQGDVHTIRGAMTPWERHEWASRQGIRTSMPGIGAAA